MKDRTTFETAKRLKDAGFPQPEPEAGQVWYHEGTAYIINGINNRGEIVAGIPSLMDILGYSVVRQDAFTYLVYAPTVSDLIMNILINAPLGVPEEIAIKKPIIEKIMNGKSLADALAEGWPEFKH